MIVRHRIPYIQTDAFYLSGYLKTADCIKAMKSVDGFANGPPETVTQSDVLGIWSNAMTHWILKNVSNADTNTSTPLLFS